MNEDNSITKGNKAQIWLFWFSVFILLAILFTIYSAILYPPEPWSLYGEYNDTLGSWAINILFLLFYFPVIPTVELILFANSCISKNTLPKWKTIFSYIMVGITLLFSLYIYICMR